MSVLQIVLASVLAVLAVALVAIITLQSGKESGLSGALTGGGKDSYLSKSKKGNLDHILATSTTWVALSFGVIALLLNIANQKGW